MLCETITENKKINYFKYDIQALPDTQYTLTTYTLHDQKILGIFHIQKLKKKVYRVDF